MSRKALPRLLGGAAALVLLVIALTAIAGTGMAQSSAAQANYAPQNTAAPKISTNLAVVFMFIRLLMVPYSPNQVNLR